MRVLVSNDDGIDAPGLALLATAAAQMTDDVWVVAPDRKWTAASHQLSFDRDLALRRVDARMFACSGAPADCVVAAMTILLADRRPDLVLAGINDKRNVGEDIAYSGTLAIAREATLWGIPAIAWSADRSNATAAFVHRLIEALWRTRAEWSGDGHWLAINLPATLPAPVEVARVANDKIASASDVLERSAERIVFRIRRGRPGLSAPGDENAIVTAGAIAVVRCGWRSDSAVPPGVLAALRNAVGG